MWLDSSTLLVGIGFRTDRAGAEELRRILSPYGVSVLEAPLPYGWGPRYCLHLMSLLSVLDEGHLLVDLSWLIVSTVEMLRDRGWDLIEIVDDERADFACNVLSLGEGRLVALAECPLTNDRLCAAGFEVLTFSGVELAGNGGGARRVLRGRCCVGELVRGFRIFGSVAGCRLLLRLFPDSRVPVSSTAR